MTAPTTTPRPLTRAQLRQRADTARILRRLEFLLHGLCSSCGDPRKDLRWKLCDRCRANARAVYYGLPKIPKPVPPVKRENRGRRPTNSKGVYRRIEADGFGRKAAWWVASCFIGGQQRSRRWAIDKWGEIGAHKQAAAQRKAWEDNSKRPT